MKLKSNNVALLALAALIPIVYLQAMDVEIKSLQQTTDLQNQARFNNKLLRSLEIKHVVRQCFLPVSDKLFFRLAKS